MVADGCWLWAGASISTQFSPRFLFQAQLLQPEMESQCSEVQLPWMKFRIFFFKENPQFKEKRSIFSSREKVQLVGVSNFAVVT